MEKCIEIRKLFESDQLEHWELGIRKFNESPQGERFWLDVAKGVQHQAKRSGVPSKHLNTSPIVEKLENRAIALLDIRANADDNEENDTESSASISANGDLPPFVIFMRKFNPDEEKNCNIWNYVLDKRIIPGLVLRQRDQEIDFGTEFQDFDPDHNTPGHPDGDHSPNGYEDRSVFQKAFAMRIAELKPIDAAICILTAWNVLDDEQKTLYRPVVIAAGVERRIKNSNDKTPPSTEEALIKQWAEETEKCLQDAEQRLETQSSETRQRAIEHQEGIAKHHSAILSISKLKHKCANRFLALGGIRHHASELNSLDHHHYDASPKTEMEIRSELSEICKLAVSFPFEDSSKRPSKEEYQEAFESIYPIEKIYKNYKAKHGAPKILNTSLWLLRRFGEYCQEEYFHWKALLSYRKAYGAMKSSLGLQDQDIATVLVTTPSNIAKRRCEYRKKVFKDFSEEIPSHRELDITQTACDTVCLDYMS